MFHLWVLLFQIGTQGALAHNDGMMGDIGFKCPTGKWTQNIEATTTKTTRRLK